MREVLARPIAKVPALRGTNVTILFYEASTRTRVSFEVAAKNLLGRRRQHHRLGSSVSKGESLVDTVRTLEALGADMLVMRHADVGRAVPGGARTSAGIVLNGGDGWHAHPTQALLDLYTLRGALRATLARAQGRDRRRRAPFARRALEHLVADRGRRGPVAVRPGDAPARLRGWAAALARRPAVSR